MSAKESSRSVVTIAQTTSSNDAIIASSKSISMSPSESRSDGTLTKKQICSIVKQIIMYVIMPLKRVATIENFSYVVVKNRALNCSDSNAMFWPKWAQKYIDQQKLMTLFNNIYINMNVSERSIAIYQLFRWWQMLHRVNCTRIYFFNGRCCMWRHNFTYAHGRCCARLMADVASTNVHT